MEFEKIKAIIAEVLNVDENEITMETTFTDDLGADSLDVFQIILIQGIMHPHYANANDSMAVEVETIHYSL